MWPLKALAYCKSGSDIDQAICEVLKDDRVSGLRTEQLKVLIAKLSIKPTKSIEEAVILACSQQKEIGDQVQCLKFFVKQNSDIELKQEVVQTIIQKAIED